VARIRTIKPEFFRNGALYRAERDTGLPLRIAFAGLWTSADRDGRFQWKPDELKLDALPHDDLDFEQVLVALERGDYVRSYMVDGKKFGYIPAWLKHQAINTREAQSAIPAPPDGSPPTPETHVHARAEHVPRGVNVPEPLRARIFERDGHKCRRCGATEDLSVDHIFPQSFGGTHAEANLRTLCRPCNSARPVAFPALAEDLARDGFTLADMPRMCMHVQAQGEGKGKEGKGKEGEGASPADAGAFSLEPVNGHAKPVIGGNPITLKSWFARCNEAHVAPIPTDDPIFDYAAKAKLPIEFVHLCWKEFKRRHIDKPTKKANWRQHFRNCVESDWYRLWRFDDQSNGYVLTTAGRQAQKVHAKAST
jgi:hypothetical protein